MTRIAAALALSLLATPALADAVTYRGTVGDLAVVVELSEEPHAGNADIFGRYFYMEKGVDIPLHAAPAARSRFGLVEEVACSEQKNNCPHAQDDPPTDPPLGAKWQLEVSRDGSSLSGEFSAGGRNRPVSLERVGSRPFDPGTGLLGLTDFSASLYYNGATLTADSSPYDYLKMTGFRPTLSDPVEMQGASFRYLADPRTAFQFPRITAIGGADIEPANSYLEQRHWMMSLDALWCVAQQYQGFGWNGSNYDAGTLGWYDEEAVEVAYLSPTVMSWTESGSLSCGYAHPYNHHEFHNLDVASGKPLDLSRVFTGWVARNFDGTPADIDMARANPDEFHWGPDEALAAFVREHRPSNDDLGLTGDPDECPVDELIGTNLAIGFKDGDTVLFSLDGLENVIFACATDLYEVPLIDIVPLLTSDAETYFPVLAD